MRRNSVSFRDGLAQFLTPQVWKQVPHAGRPAQRASRWIVQPLFGVLWTMTGCCGDSEGQRFARFVDALRIGQGGYVPLGCDGSRLECPRAAQRQARLGEAGKAAAAPTVYVPALVPLPVGLLGSWRLGQGTASAHDQRRQLLSTLPKRAWVVADAFYQGYDLYAAILAAKASFLVRLSSRSRLDKDGAVRLERCRHGLVYSWPEKAAHDQGKPPLHLRLLRVRGPKADVWLLTNVLDPRERNHRQSAPLYRWRWRSEGLFRSSKRMWTEVQLQSRTVAVVPREAEGSLIALPLLLALATQTREGKAGVVVLDRPESPRRILWRMRGGLTERLRTRGPGPFAAYQEMLARVRSGGRSRTSLKVRQSWPRRKDHEPPKPPLILTMEEKFKAKLLKSLQTLGA